jgi:hypothetical protein
MKNCNIIHKPMENMSFTLLHIIDMVTCKIDESKIKSIDLNFYYV